MKLFSLIVFAAAALLAGCATPPAVRTADHNIDIARFAAVNIAPVQFTTEVLRSLPADERTSLAGELDAALKDGLPASLLTEGRSGGVLRIEVTITELNASSPTVNLLTTALLFVPFDAGGVAFEARFYDGGGPEPFARATYRHISTPLELKGSFRRYGHAAKALQDFAEEISSGLVRESIAARAPARTPHH